jgi:Pyruvate/2-oxoacid:ferredoxin oxidoreductase gamma subunit
MQMIIMSLLEYPNAMEVIGKSIEKQFATKGDEIINANKNAITLAMDNLVLVDNELTIVEENVNENKNIF